MKEDLKINLNIDKDGHMIINTTEEYIPVKVAQDILDVALLQFAKTFNDMNADYKAECKAWRRVFIILLCFVVIMILKVKGVI